MMVSPQGFLEGYKNASYFELIKLKDELVESITEFETDYDMNSAGERIHPDPSVRYQWNLEVLSGIALMLKEAFNNEFIWGK